MICSICGSGRVEWKGPLSALTHTECADCGAVNAQVVEGDQEAEEEGGCAFAVSLQAQQNLPA